MIGAILVPGILLLAIGLTVYGGLFGLGELMQFIYDTDFLPYKTQFLIGIGSAVILMVIFVLLLVKSQNKPIKIAVGVLLLFVSIVSISGVIFSFHPENTVELFEKYQIFISTKENDIAFLKNGAKYCIIIGTTLLYSYASSKFSTSK